jgi:hypothetical protein
MIRITKTITVAALIATTLTVAIVASASGMTNSVFAQGAKKFTANLSGKEEVP